MNIRKFYEADTAEVAGGGEQSIAALMATHGIRNNTSEMVATPLDIKEVQEKPTKEEEAAPVATTTEPTKTEEGKIDTTKAKEEPVVVQEPQKAEEPAKVPTWQEVLKNQQPDTVLKELLGVDDNVVSFVNDLKDVDPKVVGIIQAYKDGKLNEYVKELNTDYAKMDSEDVMRHQLRLEYPKASPKALEVLFKKEVIEKYNLDSEDEDELAEGKLLLDAKADRFRDDFSKNQEKYLVDTYKPQAAKEPTVDPIAEANKVAVENITKQFNEDSYTKKIVADNAITFGEGEEKFSFPIDGKAVTDIALFGDKGEYMLDVSKDSNGQDVYKPKAQLQIAVATLQKYGLPFLEAYAQHWKGLGGKKVVDTIDNAKPTDTVAPSSAEAEPKTAAAAMAKQGKHVSGGS